MSTYEVTFYSPSYGTHHVYVVKAKTPSRAIDRALLDHEAVSGPRDVLATKLEIKER